MEAAAQSVALKKTAGVTSVVVEAVAVEKCWGDDRGGGGNIGSRITSVVMEALAVK